jgi:hypothetical protein
MQTSPHTADDAKFAFIGEYARQNPGATFPEAQFQYHLSLGYAPDVALKIKERTERDMEAVKREIERREATVLSQLAAQNYRPEGVDIAERLLLVVDTRPLCPEHRVPYAVTTGCPFCKTETENRQAPYREDLREEEGMTAAQSDLSSPVDQLLTGGWSLPRPLVKWWPWCVAGALLALAAWKAVHP